MHHKIMNIYMYMYITKFGILHIHHYKIFERSNVLHVIVSVLLLFNFVYFKTQLQIQVTSNVISKSINTKKRRKVFFF